MPRRFRNKDPFFDMMYKGEAIYYTPMQFIEALRDAGQNMDYSNYHNNIFERIEEILYRYANERGMKLGQSRKQAEQFRSLQHKNKMRQMKAEVNAILEKSGRPERM